MAERLLVLIGCVLFSLVGATASAQGYLGAGGVNIIDGADGITAEQGLDLYERSSVGAFGSIGYRWDDAFSTEVEGGLLTRSVAGAEQDSTGRGGAEQTALLMFNARIAPRVRGALKPYAGVGAGMAYVNTRDYSLRENHDDMAPAGQAMAGFSLEMSDRASLFAEYRYLKMLEETSGSGGAGRSDRDQSHAGFVGLRIRLGDMTSSAYKAPLDR